MSVEKEDAQAQEMETGKGDALDDQLEYTPEQEKAINRKIDIRLLPMLAVMYILSYLDRSNRTQAGPWKRDD